MLQEVILSSPEWESTLGETPRSASASYWHAMQRRHAGLSGLFLDQLPEEPRFFAPSWTGGASNFETVMEKEAASSHPGHTLFQELFFFCRVKKIGDLPGTECIYVETVVDRDSGFAFAKVYPEKSAMNAVDILASQVLPFFKLHEIAIKEIHTRNTSEYCGLPPAHPYETFLASAHIPHLPMGRPGQPQNYLCEHFYRFLLKEFFPRALRNNFQLSMAAMQDDLDIFVEAYNTMHGRPENELKSSPPRAANFPVDL
jgi:hypothetical protein